MQIKELQGKIQVKLDQFTRKYETGFSKPENKLIRQIVFGILKNGKIQLSWIGRSLGEEITQKKTAERLGRHLGKQGFWLRLTKATIRNQSSYLKRCQYLVWDNSDIRKDYAKTMEGLAYVHDGSRDEIVRGYHLCNVAGVGEDGSLIVPIYSELYSLKKESTSENQKILESIDRVTDQARKDAISVLDRGGDREKIINALITKDRHFIIRQRGDRHLVYKSNKMAVRDISRAVKLKFSYTITKKKNNREIKETYRCGAVPVRMSGKKKAKLLWLVVVKEARKGYCWLLCELPCTCVKDVVDLAFRGYGYRWKIEEVHREIKTDYLLESICLQRYEALKCLNALFWTAMSFMYTRLESLVVEIIFHPRLALTKKRKLKELFGFIYYKLALALKTLLAGVRLCYRLRYPILTKQLMLTFEAP
jgi:hypothetical protein